jgi:hypothetical protein
VSGLATKYLILLSPHLTQISHSISQPFSYARSYIL